MNDITHVPEGKKHQRDRKACVFVLWSEHFDELFATTFTVILRKAGICVYIVGLHQQRTRGECGIALYTDITMNEALLKAEHVACIVIPSGIVGLKTLENEPRLHNLLRCVALNRVKFIVRGLYESELEQVDLPLEFLKKTLIKPYEEALAPYAYGLVKSLTNR